MATQTHFKVGQMVKIILERSGHTGKIGKVTDVERLGFYNYRVVFSDGDIGIYDHHHLQSVAKTFESLVEGDMILDHAGNDVKVLAVIRPSLYVLSSIYNLEYSGKIFTAKDLEDNGYTIKQEDEAEEVVERTVVELEQALKLKPGTLRVKADEAA